MFLYVLFILQILDFESKEYLSKVGNSLINISQLHVKSFRIDCIKLDPNFISATVSVTRPTLPW